MSTMSTGDKIKRLRKKNGMTQKDFAKIIGVDQQRVSKWENDRASPTFQQIKKMAALFGVSISEINDLYSEASQNTFDEGLEEVTKDIAIDYIDWVQKRGNQITCLMLLGCGFSQLSLVVCNLVAYAVCLFVATVAIATSIAIYFAKLSISFRVPNVYMDIEMKNGLPPQQHKKELGSAKKSIVKKENPIFSLIETGNFRLNTEATKMVEQRREEFQETLWITILFMVFAIIVLVMWVVDTIFDSGIDRFNLVAAIFMGGMEVICFFSMPTLFYMTSLCRLLRKPEPQILTLFDMTFRRKK